MVSNISFAIGLGIQFPNPRKQIVDLIAIRWLLEKAIPKTKTGTYSKLLMFWYYNGLLFRYSFLSPSA
jgi:hypothetical protein